MSKKLSIICDVWHEIKTDRNTDLNPYASKASVTQAVLCFPKLAKYTRFPVDSHQNILGVVVKKLLRKKREAKKIEIRTAVHWKEANSKPISHQNFQIRTTPGATLVICQLPSIATKN